MPKLRSGQEKVRQAHGRTAGLIVAGHRVECAVLLAFGKIERCECGRIKYQDAPEQAEKGGANG